MDAIMSRSLKPLDLGLLDEAGQSFASAKPRPHEGWAKAVREALGMTRQQLGRRLGVTQDTVNTLERSEAKGTISIASLEKLARGLGGRLVYAIVPPEGSTFEQLVNERAEKVAKERMARVSHTMTLEDQTVEALHQDRQLKRVIDSLLQGSRRALWR
jgi:predicted DNA-binding mobile mystery protein A